jgi:hypothetical protein
MIWEKWGQCGERVFVEILTHQDLLWIRYARRMPDPLQSFTELYSLIFICITAYWVPERAISAANIVIFFNNHIDL